jgi:two-component sensor histidine kinase
VSFSASTEEVEMGLSIADITITSELSVRKAHTPSIVAEVAAMRLLADTMATDPSKSFQVCVDLALELCHADSCGISLRERTEAGEDIFRWIALAGQLKQHLNGTTPRFFSPCGICIDANTPVLMRRPELVYKYLDVGPPFHDVLLIPLTENASQLEGTIWIVAHDSARKFDVEDARVMQRIAVFTATALHLANAAKDAKAVASEEILRFRELDHRVKNTLMMTASLLRHQLVGIVDPAARAAIEAASGRVLAMGRVHQIGSHAATGDLAEVIRSVCTDLVAPDPRFDLKVEAESVIVPAHKAAVVALIANELVTNATKHAFGDRSAGKIAISLHRAGGDSVALSVADDGVPLPANIQQRSGGIGLNLVARFADQLAGELRVVAEPKLFTVVFPVRHEQWA